MTGTVDRALVIGSSIAGLLAARATGERVSGLIAGITAGVIVALINTVSEIIVPADALVQLVDLPPDAAQPTILDALFFRVTTLGLGAWFGWMGGRMGVLVSRRYSDR
jgi:fructose-specific phosphotransferase system IIC component